MKTDTRPQRYGWAPGDYLGRCRGAGCKDKSHEQAMFIGDKRATMCADCAYALSDPLPVDRVGNVVDQVIQQHPTKWQQVLERPFLIGWFVGRTMQVLNGHANPDDVFLKVTEAAIADKKYGRNRRRA